MARVTDNINISNARIGFRNFSGKEGQFNPAGNRNFAVFLDDINEAKKLEQEGWNIRWLKSRNEDEEEQPSPDREGQPGRTEAQFALFDWAHDPATALTSLRIFTKAPCALVNKPAVNRSMTSSGGKIRSSLSTSRFSANSRCPLSPVG